MKINSLISLVATGVIVFSLTACVSTEDQRAGYQSLSCYDLAKEIGRQEAHLDRAKDDEISSDIDSIFADNKKQRRDADIDGLFADIDQNSSQDKLNMLREIEYKKDCRNKP